MSNYWVPAVPPVIKPDSDEVTKNSKVFAGTFMKLTEVFPSLLYVEMSTNNPLPDPPWPLPPLPPVPPYPTGNHEWRPNGPKVRTAADIHMNQDAVKQMADNESIFATVMESITQAPTDLFFKLGHAIYTFGLEKAKNSDGSLDIHITTIGATAGGHVVLVSPEVPLAILQAA